MRILVVEDEARLAEVLKKGLTEDGFAVDVAGDGEEGFFMAVSESYDLLILDIMLPKKNGLDICRDLRSKGIKTPVLMLTAKSTVDEKVAGLDSGADDYVTKPFSFTELRSRVHALVRRSHQAPSPVLAASDLILDPIRHTVMANGKPVSLTPKEFSILELLMRHAGEVVTRTMIIEHVWDYNFDSMSNVVDVFIGSIRKKIRQGGKKDPIQTLHGVGYKIEI